jgi:hypothetical protein
VAVFIEKILDSALSYKLRLAKRWSFEALYGF